MSNENRIPKCLLKIFHGSLKKSFEEDEEIHFEEEQEVEEEQEQEQEQDQEQEQEEEEEELHFRKLKIKKQEQQQEQQENNEENIKQQKKVGLMCNCGLVTILREVKKEGPTKGKFFYTCSKSYDEKCSYFMWKDESDNKIKNSNKNSNKNIKKVESTEEMPLEPIKEPIKEQFKEPIEEQKENNNQEDYKKLQKKGLMCYCKLPSVSREVKKDGANKGKVFYTCSKYYDDKCKYFVWKDEADKIK